MVLEVEADSGEVNDGVDTSRAQLVRISDTRPLENQRRGEGSPRDNDLFTGPEDFSLWRAAAKGLRGYRLDSNSSAILNDHFIDLGVASQVEIAVYGSGGMDVGMCTVTPAA